MPPLGIPSLTSLAVPLGVIALFWLAALYLTKKFRSRINIRPDAARSGIKIIAAKPLGWQNSLIIVEAEGHRFLIGASRHGLTRIGRLTTAALPSPAPIAVPVQDPLL